MNASGLYGSDAVFAKELSDKKTALGDALVDMAADDSKQNWQKLQNAKSDYCAAENDAMAVHYARATMLVGQLETVQEGPYADALCRQLASHLVALGDQPLLMTPN